MASPQTVPTATSFDDFSRAWDVFMRSIRRVRGRVSREGELDLTLSQYQLIDGLQGGPLPVGRVAECAGVAVPTATRMLDGLERSDIVRREHSSTDRRVVTVALTDHGRALLDRKREIVAAKRRAVFESLDDTERAQAERLLRRLAEAMDEL